MKLEGQIADYERLGLSEEAESWWGFKKRRPFSKGVPWGAFTCGEMNPGDPMKVEADFLPPSIRLRPPSSCQARSSPPPSGAFFSAVLACGRDSSSPGGFSHRATPKSQICTTGGSSGPFKICRGRGERTARRRKTAKGDGDCA